METKIEVRQCICERCGHKWLPIQEGTPTQCPKCTSPYWNKPKKNPEGQVETQNIPEDKDGSDGNR